MNRKKLIRWVVGIPALIAALIIIILLSEPEKGGISRGSAYKAAALAITSKADCEKQPNTYFPEKEKSNWYVKYMNYLYESELISSETVPPSQETAEGYLTYGEAAALAQAVSENLNNRIRLSSRNQNQPIPAKDWWKFYAELLKEMDPDGEVKEVDLSLFGTPLNLEGASQWAAYTDQGRFGFEGLGLDSYIDKEIKVLVRQSEIIVVEQVNSDNAEFKNLWLTEGDKTTFIAYLGSAKRRLPLDSSLGYGEKLAGNLADLHMSKGKIKKIVLKKERIKGKVMSVKEDSIEIEGYGAVPLDDGFQVYKVYGEFAQQKRADVLVGYNLQEFVVANGKISAALTVRAFDAKSIRVLLMNTGFESIFHPSVTLSAQSDILMIYGDQQESIPAGQEITIDTEDKRFHDGRMIFQVQSAEDEISVNSIQRGVGAPSYAGRLEITKESDGLVLVNELYLEDYLTKVVPSEMPASYEKEALKAQAICARTYAYKQIKGNSYSQYGAHVDDSTRYQVYNNVATDARTKAAVSETYGQMLMLNDQPVEAYYFSTSSGHTTDGTIWGADISEVPYLQGVLLRDSRNALNLTTNEEFSKFIKDKKYPSYDSSFPLYRWETTITSTQLAEKITGIGTILDMQMVERGVGGIGKTLRVEGSEGTRVISGQGQIRSLLGNTALKIKKNDGEDLTGWVTLPSAFIAIETGGIDEKNVITFHIYGGGFGHGVGMSQNGAQGMAKEGKNCVEILKFFYEGVEVKEGLSE